MGTPREKGSNESAEAELKVRSAAEEMTLEMVGRVAELGLSALFVYLAVHPRTRARGAMPGSRMQGPPISRAGRLILLAISALVATDSIRGLLHKPPLEFDIVHWRSVS